MRTVLLAFGFGILSAAATAETFTLSLGDRAVGQMTLGNDRLILNVDDSPMGVANGTFTATSKRVQMSDGRQVWQYLSDTPRKGRKISVLHDAGQVIDTTVSPSGDITDMSAPTAVPGGISDFVQAMNVMTKASSCPGAMTLYEGRRVVALRPTGSTVTGDAQSCDYSYQVTGGPGHLSPLSVRNATVEVIYTAGRMTEINAGSGPFTVTVSR